MAARKLVAWDLAASGPGARELAVKEQAVSEPVPLGLAEVPVPGAAQVRRRAPEGGVSRLSAVGERGPWASSTSGVPDALARREEASGETSGHS
jgi:hypothetical protein